MEFVHRFYKVHNLLKSRRYPIPRAEIERRGYGAPIESVRGQGYRYAAGTTFELPGLWFTPSELVSLLVIEVHEDRLPPGVTLLTQ